MSMVNVDKIIAKYTPVSDQVSREEIRIILNQLDKTLGNDISGDIVEFGCYKGTTSLFMARLLTEYNTNKKIWLYDSFAGLPDKTDEDRAGLGDEFRPGELLATKSEVIQNFHHANLPKPIIKKGWFSDLTLDDVPNWISFAYFDGDYYASIRDSFNLCTTKFADKATIIVDDYSNEKLPGATRAVDEWRIKNASLIKRFTVRSSLAIIELN